MNKKVAAGVALTVAVTSIAANLAFEPGELTHSAAYLESHTRYMQQGELGEYTVEYSEPEELGKKDALRTWLLKLPVPVKALILLPLWALGAIPVAIGTGLFSAVSPILAQVASLLLQVGVFLGIFCAVYKLVFPHRKVTELFKKKNRRWLLLGAVTVTSANFAMGIIWPQWSVVRVVLTVVLGFAVLCLLWRRICGRLKMPERKMVQRRLELEY